MFHTGVGQQSSAAVVLKCAFVDTQPLAHVLIVEPLFQFFIAVALTKTLHPLYKTFDTGQDGIPRAGFDIYYFHFSIVLMINLSWGEQR
jgi:hypothetical protein